MVDLYTILNNFQILFRRDNCNGVAICDYLQTMLLQSPALLVPLLGTIVGVWIPGHAFPRK
jgi:hypothetical protein